MHIEPSVYYFNYLRTYIERDISELINIHDINLFRTFIKLCATRAGQLLNLSSLAKDCGISHTTARSWLYLLESSYIVFSLRPYHKNFSKRLVKSTKLYFYDTGLLSYLLNIKKPEEITHSALKGNIFENMIVAELIKNGAHQYTYPDYHFWRDSNKNEVDVLLKTKKGFDAYEIKSTATIKSTLFKGLIFFEEAAQPEKINKILIYGGNQNQNRTNYTIIGWNKLNQSNI